MSQYDFGVIDTAQTDGVELADILEKTRDAVNSSHSGISRPSYVKEGMVWYCTAGVGNKVFYLFDGTSDIPVGYYNTSTNIYTAANAARSGDNSDITRLSACGPEPGSVSIGGAALYANTTGYNNTAIGYTSLSGNTTGSSNTAIGAGSLLNTTSSYANTSVGAGSLSNIAVCTEMVAIGVMAGEEGINLYRDVLLGAYAGRYSSNTNGNVCIGYTTGSNVSGVTLGTFIGANAGNGLSSWSNISCLGYNSKVTGSNQVQLGNSSTTTYVYGTVQNRSDERDKTSIRPTVLGLSFINSLTPIDYKWDLRDDYKVEGQHLEDVVKNGSKTRTRYHHGFSAQAINKLIKDTGVDFGGYQDHKIEGGNDVLSLGYDEFIAPLVKAVQELSDKINYLEQELNNIKGQ